MPIVVHTSKLNAAQLSARDGTQNAAISAANPTTRSRRRD
jgi:hypothetical protein